MEPVELQTDRLVLRAVTAADEAAIVVACNDPEIAYYLPLPVPYTVDDARNFIAKSAQDWVDGNRYGFGFFFAETSELVGTCSLMSVSPGVLEVGYWSAAGYRRKGLTAEAVRRLCHWGFDALGAHRIEVGRRRQRWFTGGGRGGRFRDGRAAAPPFVSARRACRLVGGRATAAARVRVLTLGAMLANLALGTPGPAPSCSVRLTPGALSDQQSSHSERISCLPWYFKLGVSVLRQDSRNRSVCRLAGTSRP